MSNLTDGRLTNVDLLLVVALGKVCQRRHHLFTLSFIKGDLHGDGWLAVRKVYAFGVLNVYTGICAAEHVGQRAFGNLLQDCVGFFVLAHRPLIQLAQTGD